MSPRSEIAVLCVTRRGCDLARRLAGLMPRCDCYAPGRYAGAEVSFLPLAPPLSGLVRGIWGDYRAFIFIMAAGIAVRVIAPLLRDKRTDPAVLVMDEKGRHVIPLLSGHLGGANALAGRVAALIGADPVITTATDLSGLPAAELWAQELGLAVENPEAVKGVNAAMVNGATVAVYLQDKVWLESGDCPWELVDTPEALLKAVCPARILVSNRRIRELEGESRLLILRPRNLVAGVGCNRGTPGREIRDVVLGLFERAGLAPASLGRVATIDLKRDEAGLLEFAEGMGVPVEFFTREELNAMPDGSGPSEWAKRELGVKGVCEQAAMKGAGADSLLVPKVISGNVTAAVAEYRGLSLS